MSRTHIGEALRLYMDSNSLSLRQLSKQMQIPHTTLQRFIRDGDSVSTENFLRLMTWFTSTVNPPESKS